MKILAVIRKMLLDNAGVTAACPGGVHVNAVEQGAAMPNVMLMLVSGLEDFTHSGPSGLVEDRVRIWCRAKTPNETAALSQAVHTALQAFVGTVSGVNVQLIRRVMATSDYQDGAKVHRAISDYSVHWGEA